MMKQNKPFTGRKYQKIEEKKEHLTLVDYTMHLLKKSETTKVENDITKINIKLINSLFSS